MTTQSVSGSNSSANSALNPQAQTPDKSLGQKDFLRLMVAQIEHQDPMQAQPNGEFIAQLAQFSTNDGISKMQSSLQELASSLQSNQALQASALVGRTVLVNSDKLNLGESDTPKTAINMDAGINNLTAHIYSESGELIKMIPLGQPKPGFFEFAWDGTGQNNERSPVGKYRVEVHCTYAGQEGTLTTMTSANVDSVSLAQNGEGLKLNVAGIGPVSLADVKQITV